MGGREGRIEPVQLKELSDGRGEQSGIEGSELAGLERVALVEGCDEGGFLGVEGLGEDALRHLRNL